MLALPHGAADERVNRLGAAGGHHRVARQIRREVRRDADRSHARAAAAVRDAERLVQVDVADVGADRRRAGQPDLRVHVRAVHVDLAAALVHDRADVLDALLEHAVRGRIGHHQRRQAILVLVRLRPQIVDVDVPLPRAGDDDDVHADHRGAGRVGAVCRRRDQHDRAMRVAAIEVVLRGSPSVRRTPPGRRSSAAARPRRSR